jgi:hypothetical protein
MHPANKLARLVTKKMREAQTRGGKIQGIQRILEPVIEAESWDHLLLALSNICVARWNRLKANRLWYKRAVYLHRVMETEKMRRLAKEGLEAGGEVLI